MLGQVYCGELDRYVELTGEVAARYGPKRGYGLASYVDGLQSAGRVEEAITTAGAAIAAAPEMVEPHVNLGLALHLKDDFDGAKAALAESLKLRPEVTSLAQFRVWVPWTRKDRSPRYWAQEDKTLDEGLRRIGFPEN